MRRFTALLLCISLAALAADFQLSAVQSGKRVELQWNAFEPELGLVNQGTEYQIKRDGVVIGTVYGLAFYDLEKGKKRGRTYQIDAYIRGTIYYPDETSYLCYGSASDKPTAYVLDPVDCPDGTTYLDPVVGWYESVYEYAGSSDIVTI